MRTIHLNILLILTLFVYSCDTSNTGNTNNTGITNVTSNTKTPISDEDYFVQQALKNNYCDKLLFGLSFSMNKEQVMSYLEEIGAIDMYSSYYGQERRRLLEMGKLRSILSYDFCGPNEAFSVSNIILKSEDGEFLDKGGTIMFNFGWSEPFNPYNIKVYIYGSYDEKALNGDGKTYRAIKTTLVEKYGDPYKETDKYILWVDGIIHITLAFQRFVDTSLEPLEPREFGLWNNNSTFFLRPEYLITYSDWSYSQKREDELQDYFRLEQERLQKEYTSKKYKGL